MIEWWVWVLGVIGINILVIGRFLAWRKFKGHEYGWCIDFLRRKKEDQRRD